MLGMFMLEATSMNPVWDRELLMTWEKPAALPMS